MNFEAQESCIDCKHGMQRDRFRYGERVPVRDIGCYHEIVENMDMRLQFVVFSARIVVTPIVSVDNTREAKCYAAPCVLSRSRVLL